MHSYRVLYNPLAGNGRGEAAVRQLNETLTDAPLDYRDITKIPDLPEFLQSLDAEDVLILGGGDGTLNRFINATEGRVIPQDIRYYAVGSGNDFLHDLGKKPGEPPFSIKAYLNNLPTVSVNGGSYRFLNGVGYGIDGYCCEEGDRIRAKGSGEVNYTSIAIKGLLFHFKPVNATITVDGVTQSYQRVWLAPTMKGRFYGGGMMITPGQDRKAADGTVSVAVFHSTGKLKTLLLFPKIFEGAHVSHTEAFTVRTGKEITVSFDRPTALQIDGETFLNVRSYSVKAGAVSISEAQPMAVHQA